MPVEAEAEARGRLAPRVVVLLDETLGRAIRGGRGEVVLGGPDRLVGWTIGAPKDRDRAATLPRSPGRCPPRRSLGTYNSTPRAERRAVSTQLGGS